MEGTKPRTVSSLGMFDLLKGIGMLAIVFAHTAELYPLGTNDVTPLPIMPSVNHHLSQIP